MDEYTKDRVVGGFFLAVTGSMLVGTVGLLVALALHFNGIIG